MSITHCQFETFDVKVEWIKKLNLFNKILSKTNKNFLFKLKVESLIGLLLEY